MTTVPVLPANCEDPRCPWRSLWHRHERNSNGSHRIEVPGVTLVPEGHGSVTPMKAP